MPLQTKHEKFWMMQPRCPIYERTNRKFIRHTQNRVETHIAGVWKWRFSLCGVPISQHIFQNMVNLFSITCRINNLSNDSIPAYSWLWFQFRKATSTNGHNELDRNVGKNGSRFVNSNCRGITGCMEKNENTLEHRTKHIERCRLITWNSPTIPPSQYISPPIKTGLNTVGAAVEARSAYFFSTRKEPCIHTEESRVRHIELDECVRLEKTKRTNTHRVPWTIFWRNSARSSRNTLLLWIGFFSDVLSFIIQW